MAKCWLKEQKKYSIYSPKTKTMIYNNSHLTKSEKDRYRFIDAIKVFIGSFTSRKKKGLHQKALKMYIPLPGLGIEFPFLAECMQLSGNSSKNWLKSLETVMFHDLGDCRQDALSRKFVLSIKIHRLGNNGIPAVKLKVYCCDGQWITTESMVSTTFTRQYSLYNPDFGVLYDELMELGVKDAFIEKMKKQRELPGPPVFCPCRQQSSAISLLLAYTTLTDYGKN